MADSVSQDQVHKEGTDHIKETLANRHAGGTSEGTAFKSVEPITPAQPPASNPGADNPSGGIPEIGGGLSSTAHIHSPGPHHHAEESSHPAEEPQGIVGTIKNFLGFSSETPTEATSSEASEPVHAGNSSEQGYVAAAGANVASTAVAGGLVSEHTAQTALPDRTRGATDTVDDGSAVDFRNNFVNPSNRTHTEGTTDPFPHTQSKNADTSAMAVGSTGAGSTFDTPVRSGIESESTTGAGSTFDTPVRSGIESESTTGTGAGSTFDTPARSSVQGEPTTAPGSTLDSSAGDSTLDSGADNKEAASTFDSEAKGIPQAEKAVDENKETKEDTSGEKKPKSGADPKTMENRSAIPTAGGEKLGEKHWGESKIVADNPKPKTEEAGVASADGQPTSEVKDNTSKNTGGASGGPHSGHGGAEGEGKPSMAEKIKDKLPFGKK